MRSAYPNCVVIDATLPRPTMVAKGGAVAAGRNERMR